MAAALVQKNELVQDNSGTAAISYSGNVTAGNLLTIEVARFTGASVDPLAVGDLTKTAGTATIGTIAIDAVSDVDPGGGAAVTGAIYSVPCTGTGSLTVTVTGNAGDYWFVNVSEWSVGATTVKEASNAANGTGTTADSGNATSAGAALFVGLVATSTGALMVHTEDGAYTLLNEEEDASAHMTGASAYRVTGSGTTDSATWTLGSSSPWVCCVAAYVDASGGGGGGRTTKNTRSAPLGMEIGMNWRS